MSEAVDTDAPDDTALVEVEGFGSLTVRQKRFAEALHSHGNQTRAAREAGYEGNEQTLASYGSKLIRNYKVARYLIRLGKDRHLDRDEIRKVLEREAFGGEHAGARVRAAELLGKAQGMFSDDISLTVHRTTDEDLVKALAGDDQGLQAELLKRLRGE